MADNDGRRPQLAPATGRGGTGRRTPAGHGHWPLRQCRVPRLLHSLPRSDASRRTRRRPAWTPWPSACGRSKTNVTRPRSTSTWTTTRNLSLKSSRSCLLLVTLLLVTASRLLLVTASRLLLLLLLLLLRGPRTRSSRWCFPRHLHRRRMQCGMSAHRRQAVLPTSTLPSATRDRCIASFDWGARLPTARQTQPQGEASSGNARTSGSIGQITSAVEG